MSVCKACDRPLNSSEMGERVIEIEDGETIKVQEDMCKPCRNLVWVYYNDEELDQIANDLWDRDAIDWERVR